MRNYKYYNNLTNNINKKFDFYEYLSLQDNVKNMKTLLFDDFQQLALNYMKKESSEELIFNKNLVDEVDKRKKFIQILISRFESKNTHTNLEIALLRNLPEDMENLLKKKKSSS